MRRLAKHRRRLQAVQIVDERLTLNVLLSFFQFEREVIGERIRDKVAASRKRGIWMGGYVLLGYGMQDRKLVINEAEAAAMRRIFERSSRSAQPRCWPRNCGGKGFAASRGR